MTARCDRRRPTTIWLLAAATYAAQCSSPLAAAQLQGRVLDEHGEPIHGAAVLAASLRFAPCCGEEHTLLTDAAGNFGGEVEPGIYTLVASGPVQLGAAHRRIVVPAVGLSGVDLQLAPEAFVFTPDRPPVAALIAISTPTPAGSVTI